MAIEIEVLGIVTLIDDILGFTTNELLKMSWQDECDCVMNWCRENNYHYYGKPNDEFFKWEAIKEAEENGCVGVVTENLS